MCGLAGGACASGTESTCNNYRLGIAFVRAGPRRERDEREGEVHDVGW